MATIYTVFGGTLLNLGVTLSGQGRQLFANGLFMGAGDLLFVYAFAMRSRLCSLNSFNLPNCRSFLYIVSLVDGEGEEAG